MGQQRGKGAPDVQKQLEMKDRQARLRLSLEKDLDLNRLDENLNIRAFRPSLKPTRLKVLRGY